MLLKYYFLTLTIFNFLLFGYDKWCAKKGRTRIRESVLLIITLMGGTPGAFMGMLFFKHKTSKRSFLLKIGLVFIIQIAMLFLLKERGFNNAD